MAATETPDWSGAALKDLCAALRGEELPVSNAAVDLARRHRVHLVLAQAAGSRVEDAVVRAGLLAELRRAAIADLYRERELRRLLSELAGAGVHPLLLKGAALAYTVYGASHLRPRADLDVMIARGDLEVADRTVTAAGWIRLAEQSREAVTTQRHYVLTGVPSCTEQLDLHWNVAVPHVFQDALTFDELTARAASIDSLGPHARALSTPDALFLACLHRVAHHQDAADLVWLWDIHLLASRLTEPEGARFVDLAAHRAMRAVCARGLELASARFATPRLAGVLAALRAGADAVREPSADFLGGGMRQVDILHRDLIAVGGWSARLQLLGAHLVPSAVYMKSIYPHCPSFMLPLAYLHRMVRGAPEWFRRPVE
ncbi:MAG: nucleotidyltransferase family protein [Vicinamibacterales bacterium]